MPFRRIGRRLLAATGQPLWTAIDRYFAGLFAPHDTQLDAAIQANHEAHLPAIDVSPLQGKYLHVLAQMIQAKRVLEIGALGGYSTIWMARALPEDGRIVSLELNPRHAEVARDNLRRAGLNERVEIRVGRALTTLPALASEDTGPFDLIFIDADKENSPQYLEWALKLSRRGTVIVVDNVARHGSVIRDDCKSPDVVGTRKCLEMMAADPRLSSVAMQTVGVKGLDGFAMAVVIYSTTSSMQSP